MSQIKLGKTNMLINPVGLGCMNLSAGYGNAILKDEAIKIIKKAYEIGYNFFDTAESYVGVDNNGLVSNNEEIVGQAIKPFKDKVIVASKFGISHGGDFNLILDSSPKKIYESIEESLKRLQVKCIDLYYQHRIDPKVEPETVAGVMKDLISNGKIKAWGISETDENYLRKAHAVCPVTAVQNCYSMVVRKHENLIKVCEQLGITFVAYSPIANGFLTGLFNKNCKFDKNDVRSIMPQYSEIGFDNAKLLFSYLEKLAKEKSATLAQISLAWMLNKHSNLVPIPGSTKIKNIEANIKAKDIKFSKDEINQIDKLLDESNIPFFNGFSSK